MRHLLLSLAVFLLLQLNLSAQCAQSSRKDINSMSTTERTQLRDAILAYLKSSKKIVNGLTTYDFVEHHADNAHFNMIHGKKGANFVTWHRYYLQEMEHWFLANGYAQFVPLPLWNPSQPMPSEFFSIAGLLPEFQNDPLQSASTNANFTPFKAPINCNTWANLDAYANELEKPHNKGHVDIEGTMITGRSPAAAIFWPWHAWIDELYYCYQKNCLSQNSDLYIRDEIADDGTEPSKASVLWNSPDIWVRNQADGYTNTISENIYQTPGKTAHVYIRVWNRGKIPHQQGAGKMEAYWAHGSTALAWKAPWDASMSCATNVKLGGSIGKMDLRRVNENFVDFTHNNTIIKDYTIYEFAWQIPDPDHYKICFGDGWEQRHFCILARMEDTNLMPEGSDLYANIKNNNNIALKNITIFGDGKAAAPPTTECILFGNYGEDVMGDVHIRTTFPTETDAQLLNYADINLRFENGIIDQWQITGKQSTDVEWKGGGDILFKQSNAEIRGLTIPPKVYRKVCINIIPKQDTDRKFEFDLVQTNGSRVINGERYVINGLKKVVEGRSSKNSEKDNKFSDNKSFLLYPNPVAADFVELYWADKNSTKTIKLIDSFGRELASFKSNLGSFQLLISDYPSGAYFVQLIDDNTSGMESQRLMIQKE